MGLPICARGCTGMQLQHRTNILFWNAIFPVYLSLGEDAMIIEGGTGATYQIIVDQIDALGIDPKRIKYIALTHTHADHVGALPWLKALWPHLQVVAGERAPKFLGNEKIINQFVSMDNAIAGIMAEKGEIEQVPKPLEKYAFPVDKIVREGDVIDLGKGSAGPLTMRPVIRPDISHGGKSRKKFWPSATHWAFIRRKRIPSGPITLYPWFSTAKASASTAIFPQGGRP
jgi:hypothetical protein